MHLKFILMQYIVMEASIEEIQVETLSSLNQKLKVKNFIWSENEWPKIKHDDFTGGDDIPVISLRRVLEENKDEDEYEMLCKDMVNASEKWGFFTLIDHGVNSKIINNYVTRLHEIFDLPMDKKIKGGPSKNLPLGYFATNQDYGYNLPWAEIIQLLQSPQQVLDFGVKVLGDQHQPFSDAMIEYMKALEKLGLIILEMLAHGLGLQHDFFTKNFEEKESTMIRINRYPPCPLPEKCLGLGSHSDPHTLTILLQDQVGGLQVLKDHFHEENYQTTPWVGIRPIPNSFVVNIGDTLQAWTNGKLKSNVHRALVNQEKTRLSIAYFMSPTSTTMIECPRQLVDPLESPIKYVPFTWAQFKKELLIQKRVSGKTALNRFLIHPQH